MRSEYIGPLAGTLPSCALGARHRAGILKANRLVELPGRRCQLSSCHLRPRLFLFGKSLHICSSPEKATILALLRIGHVHGVDHETHLLALLKSYAIQHGKRFVVHFFVVQINKNHMQITAGMRRPPPTSSPLRSFAEKAIRHEPPHIPPPPLQPRAFRDAGD